MKVFLLMTSILISGLALGGTPVEKLVPVNDVYAPSGFDDNDNVEIIVEGVLPNLCHKSPTTSAKVVENTIIIDVKSLYYQQSNPYCPEVLVPFVLPVRLGVLSKSDYKIVVNQNSQWEKNDKLKVFASTSREIDEFQYANVDYVERDLSTPGKVILKGYNPSDCFEFDKIEYLYNGKDTLSILPKLKQVSEFCPMKLVPFSYEWELPKDLNLPKDKVLLHVRTMQGRSFNSVIRK